MIMEKSCGAVVYTEDGTDRKYIIIRSTGGHYGFPKGHVEKGESEEETALREVEEETGLRVELIPGFRFMDSHPLYKRGREDVEKEIIYFLATYRGQEPRPQENEVNN